LNGLHPLETNGYKDLCLLGPRILNCQGNIIWEVNGKLIP